MANELTQKQVTSNVATRIEAMKSEGLLIAPNYSVSNALSSAYYALKNSNSGNLLEKCTPESIYNALLDMVTQGLSPAKTQCYFIPYGNSVKLNRSYFGTMKVVKQLSEVKDIYVKVIYEGTISKQRIQKLDGNLLSMIPTGKPRQSNRGSLLHHQKVDGEEVMTIMTKKKLINLGHSQETVAYKRTSRKKWQNGQLLIGQLNNF